MSDIRIIAYQTPEEAAAAVDFLLINRVPREDISVLMSDRTHGTHFAIEENNKAAEGAGVGAMIGGALGAIAATAAAAAGLAIPGVGFLAAGPIMIALAGLGAGAATGGVAGALGGLGVSEYEAKLYEDILKGDGVLIGVSNVGRGRASLIDELVKHSSPALAAAS